MNLKIKNIIHGHINNKSGKNRVFILVKKYLVKINLLKVYNNKKENSFNEEKNKSIEFNYIINGM